MAEAAASAAAHDPTVTVTTDGAGGLDPVGDAARNLDAAQTKVTKQQAHLTGAKQAVTEAKAALAAAIKNEG